MGFDNNRSLLEALKPCIPESYFQKTLEYIEANEAALGFEILFSNIDEFDMPISEELKKDCNKRLFYLNAEEGYFEIRELLGMVMNERLDAMELRNEFDKALKAKSRESLIRLYQACSVHEDSAQKSVEELLRNMI